MVKRGCSRGLYTQIGIISSRARPYRVCVLLVDTIGWSCHCSPSSNKMLAPFPMGLRATTNPRPAVPVPTMHHPRIPSPALSNSSTDSDDSLSLLSIADLPPFSDKPSYYNYEQAAPPRPPRNPERLKECVPVSKTSHPSIAWS